MAVTLQHIEESLSVSYVSAVVGKAGASFDIVTRDYGVDVCVREIDNYNGKAMDMGVVYDCQLKSTINWEIKKDYIVYDLESDTYNKLVYRHSKSSYPCILILFCLPKKKSEWLTITENELILKNCCYYCYIKGNRKGNKKTVRIKIPRSNIFSPSVVNKLIEDVHFGVIK